MGGCQNHKSVDLTPARYKTNGTRIMLWGGGGGLAVALSI